MLPVALLVLLLQLAGLVSSGCGSKLYEHGLLADPTQDDSAELYVIRVGTYTNAAVRATVILDGAPLLKIGNDSYAKVYIVAGAHELQLEGHSYVQEFLEKRTYFYVIRPMGYTQAYSSEPDRIGFIVSTADQREADSLMAHLDPVDEIAASPQLYRSQLVESMSLDDRALWIVQDLEAAEQGLATGEVPSQEADEIQRQLTNHVHAHPEDVASCVLLARLARVRTSLRSWAHEPVPATTALLDSVSTELELAHSVLESSIERSPENAELYYWRARLYGMRIPVVEDGRHRVQVLSQPDAIRLARQAVQLEPTNARYRELLSLYLVNADQFDEALAVITERAINQHPLPLLIRDLQDIPAPEGAIPSERDARALVLKQRSQGRVFLYPELRLRFYLLPMSASEVAAFYGALWPQFQLFELDRTATYGGGEIRFLGQVVTRDQGEFIPSDSKELVDKPDGVEGVLISVKEYRNVSGIEATPGGVPIPDSLETYCFLTLINHAHDHVVKNRKRSQ